MRKVFLCFGLYIGLLGVAAGADDRPLRPITNAKSILAVYRQDWGLSSSMSPRVILAAWPDGRIVWSEDRVGGEPPYREGRIDPKKFAALLAQFDKDGMFADKRLNQNHFGPDSQFISVLIKSGTKRLELASWHEVFEAKGAQVDHRGVSSLDGRRRVDVLRKLPPDYMFFRLLWSETRRGMADLIPAVSKVSTGRPHMLAGVLSWQEGTVRQAPAGTAVKTGKTQPPHPN